jgi:hypothetical protein
MLAILSNGNVPIVQSLLGHKRVENTMKYINIAKVRVKEAPTECDVQTASSADEMRTLLSQGFQLVGDKEKFGVLWFSCPKCFQGFLNLDDKRRSMMINLK